jgi:alpha-glucosidase
MPAGKWLAIGTELNSAHAGSDGFVRLAAWQPCLALKTSDTQAGRNP